MRHVFVSTPNKPISRPTPQAAGIGAGPRGDDPAEYIAAVANARREILLRAHRFRLRREDLEDCYSQATLELLVRARQGRRFTSHGHVANAIEQRFLSRIEDRRRALAGRSPIQAAMEGAVPIGEVDEGRIEIADRRSEVETVVMLRQEIERLGRLSSKLSLDQRRLFASQLRDEPPAEFCARHGWTAEKYRKVAQRGRARLRLLMEEEEQPRPAARGAS